MFVIIAIVLELLFFLSHYDKHRNKLAKRKYEFRFLETKVSAKIDALNAEVELLEHEAETARAQLSSAEHNSGV
ncbi:MAG: hypothetical protein ACNI3A_07780 [Desulfovibrio sp.]|uniref:hypothetical protein n=1 Tax=Desulfovibrio sp. 7SRBS1 TaxID=3378064 RepID=UPI003B3F55F4